VRRFGTLLLLLTLGSAVGALPVARAAVPVVVVEGHGWGHGVGMAQDGAYWMATDGASSEDILAHFYPGTGRGTARGPVRVVVVVAPDGRASLTFPQGGEVRSPRSGPQHKGFPVRVDSGGSVTVVWDGASYRVEGGGAGVHASQLGPAQPVQLPGSTTTTAPPGSTTTTTSRSRSLLPVVTPPPTTAPAPSTSTSTTAPHGGGGGGPAPTNVPTVSSPEPVWAGPVTDGGTIGVPARQLAYRGEIEVSAATGPLRVVNEIDIEQYLWGLGEMPSSYPLAAHEAQVVAARTYAMRAMTANGEICDTQRCQVYLGVNGESPVEHEAVSKTLGETLGYGGHYASAVFSANAAGVSATPEEGFGTPNASHPYLVAAPYETHSDDAWHVEIGLADLARRLKYPGTATSIRVASTGPSKRPLVVELDGDAGTQQVRALDVDSAMGLRSTFWTLQLTTADVAPAAPEPAALIQSAPDDVGAVIAADTTQALRTTSSDRSASKTPTSIASSSERTDGDGGHGVVTVLLLGLVVAAGAFGTVVLRRTQG
jgi:SpoIID/LytB domain protein